MKHLIHLFNFISCFKVLTFFKHTMYHVFMYLTMSLIFGRNQGKKELQKKNKIVDLKNNYLTLIKRNFRNAKHFEG